MTFVEFEHRVLPRIVLPLMAGLALAAIAGRNQAQAAGRNSFVINDNEGYGITECLTNGTACGRVVADAWCEAHGYGQSVSFGRADDVTGAIKSETQEDAAKVQPIANQVKSGSLVVTCDN
ncbi:MAG TPA: hypothetical protein PKA55_07610 [Rhodoblastus sp.]|nr:hypothetical protein [Rhodoblastus sp.]